MLLRNHLVTVDSRTTLAFGVALFIGGLATVALGWYGHIVIEDTPTSFSLAQFLCGVACGVGSVAASTATVMNIKGLLALRREA
jgi:hypothetical protein